MDVVKRNIDKMGGKLKPKKSLEYIFIRIPRKEKLNKKVS